MGSVTTDLQLFADGSQRWLWRVMLGARVWSAGVSRTYGNALDSAADAVYRWSMSDKVSNHPVSAQPEGEAVIDLDALGPLVIDHEGEKLGDSH